MFSNKPVSFWERHVGSVFRIGPAVVMLIGVVQKKLCPDSVFLIFPEDIIPLCSPDDLDRLGAEIVVDNSGRAEEGREDDEGTA